MVESLKNSLKFHVARRRWCRARVFHRDVPSREQRDCWTNSVKCNFWLTMLSGIGQHIYTRTSEIYFFLDIPSSSPASLSLDLIARKNHWAAPLIRRLRLRRPIWKKFIHCFRTYIVSEFRYLSVSVKFTKLNRKVIYHFVNCHDNYWDINKRNWRVSVHT